jgi:hypothetical protein
MVDSEILREARELTKAQANEHLAVLLPRSLWKQDTDLDFLYFCSWFPALLVILSSRLINRPPTRPVKSKNRQTPTAHTFATI